MPKCDFNKVAKQLLYSDYFTGFGLILCYIGLGLEIDLD